VGTRAAGFVLTRQPPAGRWTAATYALMQESPTNGTGHSPDGAHRSNGGPAAPWMGPMGPMRTLCPVTPTGHVVLRSAKGESYEPHARWQRRLPNSTVKHVALRSHRA